MKMPPASLPIPTNQCPSPNQRGTGSRHRTAPCALAVQRNLAKIRAGVELRDDALASVRPVCDNGNSATAQHLEPLARLVRADDVLAATERLRSETFLITSTTVERRAEVSSGRLCFAPRRSGYSGLARVAVCWWRC
jgi:hypothetical protein